MDSTRFDSELYSSLGDPNEYYYSKAMRLNAIKQAVHQYSNYRPLNRRFGTGMVWLPANVGGEPTNILQVVGGPFLPGDAIVVEPYTANFEQLTVLAVARAASTVANMAAPATVTLTASMTKAHLAGSLVTKATPGLSLVAGQDTYYLPYDFMRVDQESFDLAVGTRTQLKKSASYYDSAYTLTQALVGEGFGYRQNWGQSPATGGWGVPGDPLNNPNSGFGSNTNVGQTIMRFMGGATPLLSILPAPMVTKTLDFNYYGQHVVETIPDYDFQAVLAYAKYACMMARCTTLAAQEDYTEGDIKHDFSRSVSALRNLAAQERKEFDDKIVNLPYATGG